MVGSCSPMRNGGPKLPHAVSPPGPALHLPASDQVENRIPRLNTATGL